MPRGQLFRCSPCGATTLLFWRSRREPCPNHIFWESRKHKQNIWKSFKFINVWQLKTFKYLKSAQYYKHKWILQIRSTWPVAAPAQTAIYTRRNYCLKSPAIIKLYFFRPLTWACCADSCYVFLIWRTASCCLISRLRAASSSLRTFALKAPRYWKYRAARSLFAL